MLVGKMDGGQVGLGLRIVGHGDSSALAGRAVESVSTAGSVHSIASVGCPNAAGAAVASAAASSSGTCRAAIGFHGQHASLGIDQIKPLFSCCQNANLKKRVRIGSQRDADVHGRCVAAISSVLAIRAVASIRAVSAR